MAAVTVNSKWEVILDRCRDMACKEVSQDIMATWECTVAVTITQALAKQQRPPLHLHLLLLITEMMETNKN